MPVSWDKHQGELQPEDRASVGLGDKLHVLWMAELWEWDCPRPLSPTGQLGNRTCQEALTVATLLLLSLERDRARLFFPPSAKPEFYLKK